jgi:16S rRNA processing protein RimM
MLLVVGRIGRAHGVHGEATIEVRTDLPDERFVVGTQLSTEPETNGPLTIDSARDHNGVLLLMFREVKDRTAIERIRNTLLLADVDMAQEAEFEDEYHVQQLIGCEVVDQFGKRLGELSEVLNLPGQDLLVVATPAGELLVPFIAEFVPEVDIENRKIVIHPPFGLLDLNDPIKEVQAGEHDAL